MNILILYIISFLIGILLYKITYKITYKTECFNIGIQNAQKEKKINISKELSLQENDCNKVDCYKKPKKCNKIKNYSIKKRKFNECEIWAGGGRKPSDIIPFIKIKLPEDIRQNPNYPDWSTRKAPYYTQYWTDISYNLETKNFDNLQISRKTSICIPGGTKKKIPMPKGGWPYIINFEFMDYKGRTFWMKTQDNWQGGFDDDIDTNDIENKKQFYKTLKTFTYNGYAVINLSEIEYDLYPVYDCSKKNNNISPWGSSDWAGTCWNDGNNLIRPYLNILFNKIKNNDIIPGIKFNYNNMGLIGYSGSTQMVSRCINDFPFLKTDLNICYPKIKASILIGGGSLHCYENDGFFSKDCPINKTEPNYDNGYICWENHPAVLLCQYMDDPVFNPNASTYYLNKLNRKGVPVYAMKQSGGKHALPICNDFSSEICSKFIQKYLK